MAKRFLQVCLALFLLTLSYHLGAHRATALGVSVEAATIPGGGFATGVIGRSVYLWHAGTDVNPGPVPGSEPIIATGTDGTHAGAMLANGDIYICTLEGPTPGPWTLEGNLISGVTPAHRQSLGQVKARYR